MLFCFVLPNRIPMKLILYPCFRNCYSQGVSLYVYSIILLMLCCSACEHEQHESAEITSFRVDSDSDEISDESMYTYSDGSFRIDYSVEFLPFQYAGIDKDMINGTLLLSKMIRVDRDSLWKVVQYNCQRVTYPVQNTLPLFFITDNLHVEDHKEGYRLDFFQQENRLLWSVTYSLEEWLLIIGKIRQSYYGYLPVDLTPGREGFFYKE